MGNKSIINGVVFRNLPDGKTKGFCEQNMGDADPDNSSVIRLDECSIAHGLILIGPVICLQRKLMEVWFS
jgi:hypothetical protein